MISNNDNSLGAMENLTGQTWISGTSPSKIYRKMVGKYS